MDSQLAGTADKLKKDQEFRDNIVQEVVNAVKNQFDQNSKLRQEYEELVAKVEAQEVSLATTQNLFEVCGFRPDKVMAELELQAMNLAAVKSEIEEMRTGLWRPPGLNMNNQYSMGRAEKGQMPATEGPTSGHASPLAGFRQGIGQGTHCGQMQGSTTPLRAPPSDYRGTCQTPC